MGRVPAQQPMFGNGGSTRLPLTDPHIKGRQQPLRSLQRFVPRHVGVDHSSVFSPFGQCYWCVFRRLERHDSTFLHPLAPPALPGFIATTGALTPGRLALRLYEPELRLGYRPGLPACCHRDFRSFRLQPPTVVLTGFWGFLSQAYRTTKLWPPFRGRASVGLRLFPAGSPRQMAESSSLALRTNRSPPVALHPASRRRSYHWLRDARTPRQGLSPRRLDALTGALGQPPSAVTMPDSRDGMRRGGLPRRSSKLA